MMAIPNFTDWIVPTAGSANEPTTEAETTAQAEFAALLAASYVAPSPAHATTIAPPATKEAIKPEAQSLTVPFSLAPDLPVTSSVETTRVEPTSEQRNVDSNQAEIFSPYEAKRQTEFVPLEVASDNILKPQTPPSVPSLTNVLRSEFGTPASTNETNILRREPGATAPTSKTNILRSEFGAPAPTGERPMPSGSSNSGNLRNGSVSDSNFMDPKNIGSARTNAPDVQQIILTEGKIVPTRSTVPLLPTPLSARAEVVAPASLPANTFSVNEATKHSQSPAIARVAVASIASVPTQASTTEALPGKSASQASIAPVATPDFPVETNIQVEADTPTRVPTTEVKIAAEQSTLMQRSTTTRILPEPFFQAPVRSAIAPQQDVSTPLRELVSKVTEVVRVAAAVVKTIVIEAAAKTAETEQAIRQAENVPTPISTQVAKTTGTQQESRPALQLPAALKAALPNLTTAPVAIAANISVRQTQPFTVPVKSVTIEPGTPALPAPSPTISNEAMSKEPASSPMGKIMVPTPSTVPSEVASKEQTSLPMGKTVEPASRTPEASAANLTEVSNDATAPRFSNLLRTATNPAEMGSSRLASAKTLIERDAIPEALTTKGAERITMPFAPASPNAPLLAETTPGAPPPIAQTMQPVLTLAQTVPAHETGTIRFSLHPLELGQVEVEVTRAADGSISASLTVEQADTAQTLTHGLGQLRESLEQAGVVVEQLNITTAPSLQQQTTQQFGQNTSQSHAEPSAYAKAESSSTDQTVAEGMTPATDNRLLSLHA